jgi:hypothetical protein
MYMSEALIKAASHFNVTLQENPTFGWYDRSIGSQVVGDHDRYWLRVVSERKEWITGDWWEGNIAANQRNPETSGD